MKFLKYFLAIVFGLIPLFFYVNNIFAANEFSVDTSVTYNIQESGKTIVTHNISLENNLSNLYATTYSLSLENIDVINAKAVDDKNNPIPIEVSKVGKITDIKVLFSDTSVGKGVQRYFKISYENNSFATKTGEVWEISIPRLGDQTNFRNYQLIIEVPKKFGFEAYISPKPKSSDLNDTQYVYYYDKQDLTQTGVSAGFGQFQVFSFNLSYHLENPLSRPSSTQIAIPPDTAFQKVYLQKIEPKPSNIDVDQDGNWLATYDLSSRQRIDINVSGAVQIFASYRSFPKATNQELNADLGSTEYWQTDDVKIKELAIKLKTPKAIYDYVSQNLHYDFARVQPNVQRMGAVSALENPTQAICMEFTDLFIALARSAGIPAREINGYAYTENPDLQPLGLVADVLHSWPEYYDKENGIWIPIDPTWGSTTGGEDFFNKLDLRHFAFVIHGQNSKDPYPPGSYKLGPNPQKDVFVSFGQLPSNKISVPQVTIKPTRLLPFLSSIYTIDIYNPGPLALYSLYPTVYYDSIEKNRDFIKILPPFSSTQIQLNLPYSFLGKDTPNIIGVKVDSSEAKIITNKNQIVVHSLLAISIILVIVVVLILIKSKKNKLFSIFAKIGALLSKKHAKTITKDSQNKVKT